VKKANKKVDVTKEYLASRIEKERLRKENDLLIAKRPDNLKGLIPTKHPEKLEPMLQRTDYDI
jgi:hypothetical protein